MVAVVTQDGLVLHFVTNELEADKEIVLAAVTQNGEALEYAAKSYLKADKEIFLAAVT